MKDIIQTIMNSDKCLFYPSLPLRILNGLQSENHLHARCLRHHLLPLVPFLQIIYLLLPRRGHLRSRHPIRFHASAYRICRRNWLSTLCRERHGSQGQDQAPYTLVLLALPPVQAVLYVHRQVVCAAVRHCPAVVLDCGNCL